MIDGLTAIYTLRSDGAAAQERLKKLPSNAAVYRKTRQTPWLFVPGTGATPKYYATLVEHLRKHGIAASVVDVDKHGLAEMREDVKDVKQAARKLMRETGATQINIGGHSKGAPVALRAVMDDPVLYRAFRNYLSVGGNLSTVQPGSWLDSLSGALSLIPTDGWLSAGATGRFTADVLAEFPEFARRVARDKPSSRFVTASGRTQKFPIGNDGVVPNQGSVLPQVGTRNVRNELITKGPARDHVLLATHNPSVLDTFRELSATPRHRT